MTTATYQRMPRPPAGYAACRTGHNPQVSHLVALDEQGGNMGRPTVCGLTRFDQRDPATNEIVRPADLPGWSMGGGVEGPDVVQAKCPGCWPTVSALGDDIDSRMLVARINAWDAHMARYAALTPERRAEAREAFRTIQIARRRGEDWTSEQFELARLYHPDPLN